jgi:hypothetical protein
VEVLEDQDERFRIGDRLEEVTPGGERRGAPFTRVVAFESEQRPEVGLQPVALARVDAETAHSPAQLRPCRRRGVGLEDPDVRLHDLADRREGDPVAVGNAAALEPARRVRVVERRARELVNEPALPDARRADECYQV